MLCFSLLDFLMPPLAFVFFYFLFSVSALHWFSSSTNHQHCSVLLCCNCNAHLYFHLITTVHALITREATNRIKANSIMWEYEQKNGGKETRRERKEGGANTLSNKCNNTSDWHLLSHKGNTVWLQRKHTDRYRHSSIKADWHLCFYYSSKNEEYHCFWVFCKNCNINDFIRGHPVSVTVFLSILFTSMIYICLASMCFRVSSCVFLVLCYLFIWSCPGRRGLCRSVSVLCFLFYFSSALCSVLLPLSPYVLICSSCVLTCCPSFKSSLSARGCVVPVCCVFPFVPCFPRNVLVVNY